MEICFIQGAHSKADQEKIWINEWSETFLFSDGTNRAIEVAILIKPWLDMALTHLHLDSSGGFLIVDAKLPDTPFKLVNVYAPNSKENEGSFYHHLGKNITHEIDIYDNTIIGWDGNVIQNPQLERNGGVERKENDRRKLILNDLELIKETIHVCEIWRIKRTQAVKDSPGDTKRIH